MCLFLLGIAYGGPGEGSTFFHGHLRALFTPNSRPSLVRVFVGVSGLACGFSSRSQEYSNCSYGFRPTSFLRSYLSSAWVCLFSVLLEVGVSSKFLLVLPFGSTSVLEVILSFLAVQASWSFFQFLSTNFFVVSRATRLSQSCGAFQSRSSRVESSYFVGYFGRRVVRLQVAVLSRHSLRYLLVQALQGVGLLRHSQVCPNVVRANKGH